MDDTRIEISYGSYRWVATEQEDRETFLCVEDGDTPHKYVVHEDQLDAEISRVLEGSVS